MQFLTRMNFQDILVDLFGRGNKERKEQTVQSVAGPEEQTVQSVASSLDIKERSSTLTDRSSLWNVKYDAYDPERRVALSFMDAPDDVQKEYVPYLDLQKVQEDLSEADVMRAMTITLKNKSKKK